MRRALRQPLAVAFALLVVTAGALGTTMLAHEDVRTLEEASDQYVQRGAAFNPSDAAILGYASGAIETYQEFIGGNQPTDSLEAQDWKETHTNIYQSMVTQKGNNDATHSVMENYLNDTRSIALMTGKKAYVEALERGATKGEAEIAAYEAIEGYYVTKQENLISAHNATMMAVENAIAAIGNSSQDVSNYDVFHIEGGYEASTLGSVGLSNTTLVDGSTHPVLGTGEGGSTSWYPGGNPPDPGGIGNPDLLVKPPANSNLETRAFQETSRVVSLWNQIETQNDQTQQRLSEFINATYDSYEAGDLDASDFVDPYLGAREYDPETSNTWALRSLTSMGVEPPENLSNIGRMNVSEGGTTYTGVLMSDGAPQNGFVVNQTYNTSTLSGPQWVALDDGGAHQLEGQFTLESATRADGAEYTANESITYEEVNYSTANLTELKELNEQINELNAEINARQQRLRNSGGVGWLPDLGGLNVGSVAPVVLIAGGALVLLGRN